MSEAELSEALKSIWHQAHHLSKHDLEWLRSEIEALLSNVDEAATKLDSAARSLNALTGTLRGFETPLDPTMMVDRHTTENYLRDSNPKHRRDALRALYRHWGVRDELEPVCERMICHDPDSEVRAQAALLLGFLFVNTRNPRIAALVARNVANANESPLTRLISYMALFDVTGRPMREIGDLGELRVPEHIDWPFVQSFLTRT